MAPCHGCGLTLWNVASCVILWSIWKKRNDRIFNGAVLQVEEVLDWVFLRLSKWVSYWEEFKDVRLEDFCTNGMFI